MKTLLHVDGFKYACQCGVIVDIGRHFTEEEQEWIVCNTCASELLDMVISTQRLSIMSKIKLQHKEMKLPKLV